MNAYDKASLALGTKLQAQGLTVISVTKIGRTFHVALSIDTKQEAISALSIANKTIIARGTDKDLRTGNKTIAIDVCPKI